MEQSPLLNIPSLPTPTTVQLIEALLFVAGEPVTVTELARVLDLPPDAVEQALDDLAAACAGRGVRLQRDADRVQMVSAPEAAAVIERFLGAPTPIRLSTAALETLTIIAYRQPITRAQIEAIRGVDSSSVLRALMARDLIAEGGRLETVGRPILYVTTAEFLRQFGLSSLADLPPLELPEAPAA
ncbi:MAG: SMC-Scp complex subunit ScpB [Roseiflexus sp.]|nr:SMC-Scp complex subunit ScpB [Roseiflexus sp.]MCS7289380.1 SMC-Scp complex subunit ScpB [Roseiflexus sp.]MDW8145097.1 SMC-Scp complex subunit ScpB [Roseiflexaceae bacterium]MDW8233303.1 SMC-Scp complex subunit ScpB [Roseiflexaceae bacterium]